MSTWRVILLATLLALAVRIGSHISDWRKGRPNAMTAPEEVTMFGMTAFIGVVAIAIADTVKRRKAQKVRDL
jgi:hypothetical protein